MATAIRHHLPRELDIGSHVRQEKEGIKRAATEGVH